MDHQHIFLNGICQADNCGLETCVYCGSLKNLQIDEGEVICFSCGMTKIAEQLNEAGRMNPTDLQMAKYYADLLRIDEEERQN